MKVRFSLEVERFYFYASKYMYTLTVYNGITIFVIIIAKCSSYPDA